MGEKAFLLRLADRIDAVVDGVGRTACWLILLVVALLFWQIPMREFVHYGHREVNDMGQLVHATVFMIGVAYAMRWDGHVRVDIFYHRIGARRRAVVDLVGTIFFILPWLFIVTRDSIPIVLNSWAEFEAFDDTYTPGYFVFKTQLLVFAALMILQVLANILRDVAVLREDARA